MGELSGVDSARPRPQLIQVRTERAAEVTSAVREGREAIEIIAHRGFSARFPENTLPSLLGALDAGADAIEWDIQVASDGVPVLFHDEYLDRTTNGRGPMYSRSSSDLARLDAGSWLSQEFANTGVPSLSEALSALGQWGGRIYPEVKSVRSYADLAPILGLLRDSAFHSRSVLISLDHNLLEEVRTLDSEIHLGWVVAHEEDMERCMQRVADDGRAVLDPAAQLLLGMPTRTREIVSAGIPLATWTVNEIDEAQALFALGVRRFTTNQVSRLVEWARLADVSELDR